MSSNFAGSMVLILDPREALSFELADLLGRALSPDPAKRPSSPSEFAAALDACRG